MINIEEIEAIIEAKGIRARDASHRKCIELFVPFLKAYKSNQNTIKSLIEIILNKEVEFKERETACFNGRYDNGKLVEPFDVDLYIQYDSLGINLYYVSSSSDIERALNYKENTPNEFKMIVYNKEVFDKVQELKLQNCIIVSEDAIRDYSDNPASSNSQSM